jgi:hypothetical protein
LSLDFRVTLRVVPDADALAHDGEADAVALVDVARHRPTDAEKLVVGMS